LQLLQLPHSPSLPRCPLPPHPLLASTGHAPELLAPV